jgi:hypothetical protein
MEVSKQFNKFAGKEVAVIEKPWKIEATKRFPAMEGVTVECDGSDAVIVDLVAEAAKAGFNLRIWTPGVMGTCDWQPSRLNVHIEKEDDGKYRIQPNMSMG